MPFDLEHARKEAKRLVRSFRAGDAEARARAETVLGARARDRFALADAQHVVARERGHRSWPELKRSLEEVEERLVETGRVYREGEPVRVRVRGRRGHHRWLVTDDGRAADLAGRPPGWRDMARRVALEDALNASRSGAIFVPTVYGGYVDELVERVAAASLALYESLLDLE